MKKLIVGLRKLLEKHGEFINSLAKGVISANLQISTGGGYLEIN